MTCRGDYTSCRNGCDSPLHKAASGFDTVKRGSGRVAAMRYDKVFFVAENSRLGVALLTKFAILRLKLLN